MIYGNKFLPGYLKLQEATILSEVYFGKTPEILELQDAVSAMRRAARKKGRSLKTNDKAIVDFCKTVEKIFGFDTVGVMLMYTNMINAACMPIGRRIGKGYDIKSIKNNLIVDENNFKYKKEAHYNAMFIIFLGLLTSPDYTDAEVTAILLHEIGHNFSDCFNPNKIEVQGYWAYLFAGTIVESFTQVWDILKDLARKSDELAEFDLENTSDLQDMLNQINVESMAISVTFVRNLYVFILRALTSSAPLINALVKGSRNGFNIIINGIYQVYGFVLDFQANYNALIALSPLASINSAIATILNKFSGLSGKVSTVLGLPILARGYKDERLADKFVAVYGYSTELGSALDKMGTTSSGVAIQDYLANNKFLGAYYNTVRLPGMIVAQLLDEHPESISRVTNNIAYLESELKKQDISPEMKAAIQENITASKAVLKKMTEVNKRYSDNFAAKKLYYSFLVKTFGGDPRDALIKSADEMDKMYKEKLNKK